MSIHYLETGSVDPCYNLALEQYVLEHRREGDWLMLWQNRNTVVVGLNQNTAEEIDPSFVEEHNITVVRRMTGGGAVYHDLGNLNYSFIRDVGNAEELTIRRFTELRCMFHRQEGLWRNVNNLRRSLLQNIGLHETDPAPQKFRGTTSVDGTSQIPQIVLLDKALEAGEISLEQYLVQVDYYYSVELRIISIAYELEQLHLQLAAIEL